MKRLALIAVSVLGVFGGILWVAAPGSTAAAPALTGQDYGEIMRLYGLYNQGSYFRDAEMFVSAFSDDAVFNTGPGQEVVGREALLAQRAERYQGQTGDNGRRHHNSSWVITPPMAARRVERIGSCSTSAAHSQNTRCRATTMTCLSKPLTAGGSRAAPCTETRPLSRFQTSR